MPRVGFEPTIAAGKRPKTYALDRTATGTGHLYITLLFLCVFCFVLFCFLTFVVHLFPPHFEAVFYYSQPSFCLIHRTMRTARVHLKQHPADIVTAFYPFPYKCIHLSSFCVSKQNGHEQDTVSLAVLFAVHKKVYDISCREMLYELAEVVVRTCPKNVPHSVYSLCLCTSSALWI